MDRWWRVALLVLAWAAGVAGAGGIARAQTPPHAELPSVDQPVRRVPITGYTLALGWAPEYCHARARGGAGRGRPSDDAECGPRGPAGFTLHGLWPDGAGAGRWPQYCHPVAILTEAQLAPALAATPSRQLLQHEWAKHGSCMGDDPARYFAEEGRLFRALALPDLQPLARRRDATAGDVAAAFVAANPGLPAQAVRVTANRRGWLQEVWLCLGPDRRPRPCNAASQGVGVPAGTPLRIEAGRRGGYQRDRPRDAYRARDRSD